MPFTSATLRLPDGNDIFYTDSGPVPGSTDYTTLIIVHGSAFNGHIFEKLHGFSAKNNFRTVVLNRRDYPGSTKYSDAELDDLRAGQPAFLERTSIQMAHFVAAYIQKNVVPEHNEGNGSGGVVVAGWSMGCVTAMSLFGNPNVLPPDSCETLRKSVKRLVLYDPPYFAFALELPSNTTIYDPWMDPSIKSPEEKFRAFTGWVSSYFDVPEGWSGSLDELDSPKRTDRATVDSLTNEDLARFYSPDAAVRSEIYWFLGPLQASIKDMVTRCLWDEKLAGEYFSDLRVVYITCRRAPWHATWAAHRVEQINEEYTSRRAAIRPMQFVPIEDGNHFVHYDDPQALLTAIRSSL